MADVEQIIEEESKKKEIGLNCHLFDLSSCASHIAHGLAGVRQHG